MENPSEFNGDVFDSLFDDNTTPVDDPQQHRKRVSAAYEKSSG